MWDDIDMWANQRSFDRATRLESDFLTLIVLLAIYGIVDYNLNWEITETIWTIIKVIWAIVYVICISWWI